MSFFGSLFGGGNTAAGFVNDQKSLVKRNTALVGGLTDAYNSAARAGAWDPNAQLDSLAGDTAYATKMATGNAAAAARTMGYRPGDTAPIDAQTAINAKARLDYADEANRIRTGALQAGYQAASGLAQQSSNIYGNSAQMNQPLIQYGEQQDARQGQMLGTLLNTALPFLSGGTSLIGGLAAKAASPDITKMDGYSVKGGTQYLGPFVAGRVRG